MGQVSRVFEYKIDRHDAITDVDEDFRSFAVENGADSLASDSIIGQTLWEHIEGKETRHLYRLMLQRIRKTGGRLRVPYRCDSPDCRRFMELEIYPLPDQKIGFTSRIVKQELQEPVDLFSSSADRSEEFLGVCSWRKRMRVEGVGSVEVDKGVAELDLFEMARLPQLMHSICPDCLQSVEGEVRKQLD